MVGLKACLGKLDSGDLPTVCDSKKQLYGFYGVAESYPMEERSVITHIPSET